MQSRCATVFLWYPCKTMTIRSLRVTNNIGLMRALLPWRRRFSTCCINYKSPRAQKPRAGAAVTAALIRPGTTNTGERAISSSERKHGGNGRRENSRWLVHMYIWWRNMRFWGNVAPAFHSECRTSQKDFNSGSLHNTESESWKLWD